MAGRPRKPTRLKVLHGSHETALKQKEAGEPKPQPIIPPKPDWIKGDAIANAWWDNLAPTLHRTGLLTELDGPVLAILCSNASLARRCTRMLKRNRLLMVTPSGYKQQSPYIGVKHRAEEMILRCATEFGMSPAARSRILGGGLPAPAMTPSDLTMGGLLQFNQR